MFKIKITYLLIIVVLFSTINQTDSFIVNDETYESMIDIFQLFNAQENSVNIQLNMNSSNFDLLILDTNYYLTIIDIIFGKLTPVDSPHLLIKSEARGTASEIVSYNSEFEYLFIVVYSLDELNGISSPEHNYDLLSEHDYLPIDFKYELNNIIINSISENHDNQFQESEFTFYQFNLSAGEIIDISSKITDVSDDFKSLVVILSDQSQDQMLDDINDAMDAIQNNEIINELLPESVLKMDLIIQLNTTDAISYISYNSLEDVILNYLIFSYNTDNPDLINYEISSSIIHNTNKVDIESIPNYNGIIFGVLLIVAFAYLIIKESRKRRSNLNNISQFQPDNRINIGTLHPNQQFNIPSQNKFNPIQKPVSQAEKIPISNEIKNENMPTLNFCEYCGNKLKSVKNFCASCGAKVKNEF